MNRSIKVVAASATSLVLVFSTVSVTAASATGAADMPVKTSTLGASARTSSSLPARVKSVKIAASSDSKAVVRWGKTARAAKYQIKVGSKVVVTTKRKVTVNAIAGTLVRVRAVARSGRVGAWSSAAVVKPRQVAGVRFTRDTQGGSRVQWRALKGARSYEVRAAGKIYKTKKTSLSLPLVGGAEIRVRAIALRKATGPWSTRIIAAPAAPAGVGVTDAGGAFVTVQWRAVPGAKSYQVGVGSALIKSTSLTATFTADASTPIKVRAVAAHGALGHWSPALYRRAQAPSGLKVTAASSSYARVTWDAVPGATLYRVEIDGVTEEVTTNSAIVMAYVGEKIRVAAKGLGEWSPWTSEVAKPLSASEASLLRADRVRITGYRADAYADLNLIAVEIDKLVRQIRVSEEYGDSARVAEGNAQLAGLRAQENALRVEIAGYDVELAEIEALLASA